MAFDLLLISGSTRAGSTNGTALATAAKTAAAGVTVRSYDGLTSLPHFSPDDDVEPLPAPVADLRQQLGEAGALLFCTPEYAGALPGSLKNLLDWAIGGGELSGKPVGWLNASVAVTGAAGAYAELRTVLRYADTALIADGCAHVPVGRPDVGPDGLVADPDTRALLVPVVAALVAAGRRRV